MTPGRKSSKRWWLAGFFLFGAICLLIFLTSPDQQEWIAPDGTSVTLQKVTYGKRHEHFIGGPLAQLRHQVARIPLLSRLGLKPPIVLAQNRSLDCTTVWFRVHAPTNIATAIYSLWVVDSATGLAAQANAIRDFPLGNGESMLAATFDNYPRGTAAVRMQLNIWRSAAPTNTWFSHQFRAPKRNSSSTPQFPIQVPLGTAAEDGISIAVGSAVTGVAAPEAVNPTIQSLRVRSSASFTVRENGTPSTNWVPHRIEAVSTKGNRFLVSGSTQQESNGEVSLLFQATMWPAESPWRFRVEFTRVGNFPPDALWHYRISDVRALLESSPAAGVTNWIAGYRVTIMGLKPGSQPGSGLELQVRLEAPQENFNLSLLSARNAAGDPLFQSEVAYSRGNGTTLKVFSLGSSLDDSLDLVLAVHKNHHAEFSVTPTMATPIVAPNAD